MFCCFLKNCKYANKITILEHILYFLSCQFFIIRLGFYKILILFNIKNKAQFRVFFGLNYENHYRVLQTLTTLKINGTVNILLHLLLIKQLNMKPNKNYCFTVIFYLFRQVYQNLYRSCIFLLFLLQP